MPELRALKVQTLDELNAYFWAWLDGAYHHREHSELKANPAGVFANDPHPLRLADPAVLAEAFLQRQDRKVDKTGCVSAAGAEYDVGPDLARRKVELRYDPYTLQSIQVWQDGRKVGVAYPVDPTACRSAEQTTGLSCLPLLKQQ